jgi:ABC-type uncharacterized transport system auxiliary subunit
MPVRPISFSVSRLLREAEIKNKDDEVKMMKRFLMRKHGSLFVELKFIFLLMMLASGCSLGAKPAYLVNQYTLEYPSPVLKETTQINELIKVERFFAAQIFDSLAMVYKEGPNLRNVDAYNRWRIRPGDMVTDYLVRDLRNSGLFRAIFSYNDSKETRYLLEGQVDEFLEVNERDGKKAVLSLNVTFLDLKKKEILDRVIFQRDYKFMEPVTEKTPESFAQGMSKAMEKFSKQLISDIHQVLKNR